MSLYDPELEVGSRLEAILIDVGSERRRQDALKAAGRFTFTPADAITHGERMLMLTEEVGEVAREALTQPGAAITADTEGSRAGLRAELVQVAAIAVAWIEGLDRDAGLR